jgi:hypothetical protein
MKQSGISCAPVWMPSFSSCGRVSSVSRSCFATVGYGTGKKNWTLRHRRWLASQDFEQTAHRIVFQDYVEAVWAAQDRRDQLEARIVTMLPEWSMAGLVEALRTVRGLDLRCPFVLMEA